MRFRDVWEPLSEGCNRLIAQGAGLALTPESLLLEWKIAWKRENSQEEKRNLGLQEHKDMVYSCLSLVPKHLSEIAKEAKMTAAEAGTELLALRLEGLAEEPARNYYVRK